ncbi:glycosyltransferase [Photobacterium swingsii]|uniref:glycosyltransferase n=1 Tax=Photobacterium swingsii TaxID=680026 RepID=UPI0040689FC2
MNKVIHVINAMEIGGVEVGVLSLLKSSRSKDYNVVTVKGCDSDLYESLSVDEKARLHICDGYFNALMMILKLKPQLVITSLWRAHLVGLVFGFFKPKIKRVHFEHNAGFSHIVDNYVTRLSVFFADFVFCDSKQSQSWLNNPDKSLVVPMNVSFSSGKKTTKFDPLNFVFVGRFCKQKNILKSIQFVEKLNLSGLHSTLDLYGRDDGELDKLRSYVNVNGLCELVCFHKSIQPTEVEDEMKKYNFYLQTSDFEGMSISVYQSIKNGLLPVVTPVGEIPKYTENGVNAFYLSANDLDHSVQVFKKEVISGSIKNYRVGHMINTKDYPCFDEAFFLEVDNFNC